MRKLISMVLLPFRLGGHYISSGYVVGTEQYFDVMQIIQHENYNSPKQLSNDIALLKLSIPVGLVCLSDGQFQRQFNYISKKCWTTGWGRLSYLGFNPIELMQVDVPFVCPQNFSYLYSGYDANTMICHGRSQGSRVACHGDSGGPLVCEFNGKWYLEGATSWGGLPCVAASKPTVYADVRKVKSWITRKMNNMVPIATSKCVFYRLAQLVEQRTSVRDVVHVGSNSDRTNTQGL